MPISQSLSNHHRSGGILKKLIHGFQPSGYGGFAFSPSFRYDFTQDIDRFLFADENFRVRNSVIHIVFFHPLYGKGRAEELTGQAVGPILFFAASGCAFNTDDSQRRGGRMSKTESVSVVSPARRMASLGIRAIAVSVFAISLCMMTLCSCVNSNRTATVYAAGGITNDAQISASGYWTNGKWNILRSPYRQSGETSSVAVSESRWWRIGKDCGQVGMVSETLCDSREHVVAEPNTRLRCLERFLVLRNIAPMHNPVA